MVTAVLNGLLFDGTDAPAVYTIRPDGLKGWTSGVQSVVPTEKRPQSHGEFQGPGRLGGRLISIEGVVHSDTPAEQEDRINALSGLLADGEASILVVNEASGSKYAHVRRVDEPNVRILVYGHTAEYQVRFRAADPRRYATGEWAETTPPSPGQGQVWPETSPEVWPGGGSTGRVTLTNNGRAPSQGSFVLAGGFGSALITCVETGERIGFARPIAAGSTVVIENGRAKLDGQDVSRWLRFREWTPIPGGFSRTFQLDVTDPVGTPRMIGKADHAWW